MLKLATLLTDFTETDGYPAVMKGVMLSIAPEITIVDLSHSVPPHDIMRAALLLARSVTYFPAGTVHVCVIDPGVGTGRRGIIAQIGGQVYVCPDNGLITLVYNTALRGKEPIHIYSLENPDFMLKPMSRSFHGRDVFAPAAAHFLSGIALEQFGQAVADPVLHQIPQPEKTEDGWIGEILHIDAFGNLAVNIRSEHLAPNKKVTIILGERTISGLLNTFGEGNQGSLVAIIDSGGYLSICVVNGSAKQTLKADLGDSVKVLIS